MKNEELWKGLEALTLRSRQPEQTEDEFFYTKNMAACLLLQQAYRDNLDLWAVGIDNPLDPDKAAQGYLGLRDGRFLVCCTTREKTAEATALDPRFVPISFPARKVVDDLKRPEIAGLIFDPDPQTRNGSLVLTGDLYRMTLAQADEAPKSRENAPSLAAAPRRKGISIRAPKRRPGKKKR